MAIPILVISHTNDSFIFLTHHYVYRNRVTYFHKKKIQFESFCLFSATAKKKKDLNFLHPNSYFYFASSPYFYILWSCTFFFFSSAFVVVTKNKFYTQIFKLLFVCLFIYLFVASFIIMVIAICSLRLS